MAERKLTIKMNADTKNLQKGMAAASLSTKKFGTTLQNSVNKMAPGLRKTGIALAGVGAAMTAMSGLAIKAGMDFQKQLANVSTMLDDVSMHLMPAYADGLREMSKEFGESTETLSRGLYDILSASVDSAKAMDVLEVSAKAARAGLTDTAIAADAITTIINSYGMAVEDAALISDMLFATVKRGKLTFPELAASIGNVAATASIAGLDLSELNASIATITRNGIDAAEAMTSIRGVLLAFIKPTDDAKVAAKEFGLELSSNTLRTIGLTGVMDLLSEATAEQLAAIFPNVRGLKGMAAALQDTEGFAKDLELQLNALGLTEEAFTKQTDTLAFAFDQLKQEVKDIFVGLGESLVPIIQKEVIPVLKRAAAMVSEFGKSFGELEPQTQKFLLALGPLLIALGGFLIILPSLASLMISTGTIIATVLGFIGLPLALLIALLGTLALVWILNWGKITAELRNFWVLDIQPILEKIWDWLVLIKDVLVMSFQWTLKLVGKAWDIVATFWLSAGSWLKAKFEWALELIGMGWTIIKAFWTDAWSWLKVKFEWFLEAIGTGWEAVSRFWLNAWDWVSAKFSWLIEQAPSAWETIKAFWASAKDWLVGKFEWTLEKLGTVWDAVSGFWAAAWEWLKPTFEWTLKKVGTVWNAVSGFWVNAWGWIEQSFWWTLKKAGEGWDWFAGIMQWVKMHAGFAFNWLLIKIGETWKWFENILWPWVKEWAVKAYEWALEWGGKLFDWFKDTMIPWTTEFGKKTFEWTLKLLGGAWDKIKELLLWPTNLWRTDWELWPQADENTRKVIDNIEEIAKTVGEKIGEEIPKDLQLMSIALMASESSFDKNAKAVDALGNEYKGLGQHGKLAIKDLEEMGLVIDDINDPAQAAAATMAFFSKILKANGGDVKKSILIYKGWGKELKKQGGSIEKMPKAAKKQLDKYLKLLKDFAKDSEFYGTLAGEKFVWGGSPGGVVGEIEDGNKDLKKTLDKMLGNMDKMTKDMSKVFKPIIGIFEVIFQGVVKTIKVFDQKAGDEFESFVKDTFKLFKDLFKEDIPGEIDNTSDAIDRGTTTWFNYIKRWADAVPREIIPKWQAFVDDLKQSFATFLDDIESDVKTNWSTMIDEWSRGAVTWENLWTDMWESFKNTAIGKLSEIVSNAVWSRLEGVLKNIGGIVIDVAVKFGSNLWSALVKVAGAFWEVIAGTVKWIGLNIAGAVSAIIPYIWGFVSALGSLIGKIWGAVAALVAWIGKGIAAMAVAIVEWFAKLIPIVGWILGIAAAALAVSAIKGLISGFSKGGLVEGFANGGIPAGEDMLIGVKRGEMILPKEMVDWLRGALASPGPMSSSPSLGGIAGGGQAGGGVTVHIPRGAVIVYGDIRTKMDEEEFIERAGTQIGEQVGKEILRTVPL